jgi:EAL domain-containing protein (putative c-di-GMP-specific phosphodiesterase class I)
VARAQGLKVIAEGIESPTQLAILRKLGCDAGQEFLLARPAAPEETRPLLDRTLDAQLTPADAAA